MSAVLLERLRTKGRHLLLYLGTHGLTVLLLVALLAAVILLE
jgi:hypothetical protein